MKNHAFVSIPEALEELRQGRMIILVDSEGRENEGDLVMAAEKVTPEAINFMTKYGRGLVCLAMSSQDIDRLNLPMMVKKNQTKLQTAFTVSIEAASGVTTGISASDRAHTIRVAIDDQSTAQDIISPGHIFPLKARDGGVLARAGHTEGGTDLARLAGLKSSAVICEILREDGSMARVPDLIMFGKEHNLKMVSIADLIVYRIQNECVVTKIAEANLPLREHGNFRVHTFESQIDSAQHLALVSGQINTEQPCLVRLHSECLTGDTFGSTRCDCGLQLNTALQKIATEGGILLYLPQEGRGIGLGNKIRAYALQDKGLDTVEANRELGFGDDERDYGIAAQILRMMGVQKIRLMTNNPRKVQGISRYGIEVTARQSLEMQPSAHNISYLKTKREKLGHLFTFDMDKINEDHYS